VRVVEAVAAAVAVAVPAAAVLRPAAIILSNRLLRVALQPQARRAVVAESPVRLPCTV
jgi:hypothetical protein